MNNYIGKVDAEWVDPKVELPPDGWDGLVRTEGDPEAPYGFAYLAGKALRPVMRHVCAVAWLRIGGPSTAIPRITGRHPDGSDALQAGLVALGYDGLVGDDECACDGCISCGCDPSGCSCAYEHKYHPSHCTNWYDLTPCDGDCCEVCGKWKPEDGHFPDAGKKVTP